MKMEEFDIAHISAPPIDELSESISPEVNCLLAAIVVLIARRRFVTVLYELFTLYHALTDHAMHQLS